MPTTRLASDYLNASAGSVVAAFSSLALGGATIGAHALAITGTSLVSAKILTSAAYSKATATLAFGDSNGGISFSSGGTFFSVAGNSRAVINASGFTINGTNTIGFTAGEADAAGADAVWARDGANWISRRNGTATQIESWYDTFASSTDFHRVSLRTVRATLSGVSGASVTATNLIPDGAIVIGVTTKVTTGLGTGNGTTGYTVGDGSDVDRWGAVTGTASGTSSDNRDWTATTVQAFTSANNVVLTATGGNFDGTGVIYVSVQYLIGEVD